LTRGAELSS